jgi:lysyl-tRNA synthetase class 2
LAKEVYGKTKFVNGGMEFDLADDWEELDYLKIVKEKIGIDIVKSTDSEMAEAIKKAGVKLTGEINRARLIDNCWKIVRKTIAGPAFLLNEPKFMSPLAKSKPEDPEITERFHIILAGSEQGNGYSELNDPVDQKERFEEQQKGRDKGDEEAQMMDTDFVEMLSYGMPPTSGFGMSERLFWAMEDISAREGTLFPPLRVKKD